MVASPFPFAVTNPLSTVATPVLEDCQVIVFTGASLGLLLKLSCSFSPTTIFAELLSKVAAVIGLSASEAGSSEAFSLACSLGCSLVCSLVFSLVVSLAGSDVVSLFGSSVVASLFPSAFREVVVMLACLIGALIVSFVTS